MRCPKCPGTLETRTFGRKIAVRRCTDCAGVFCSPAALVELKREWRAELALDPGDPRVGRTFDGVGDLDCPACGAGMATVVDSRQTHIRFERCPACEGMFFDAGELSDLKHDTFMDRVRGLLRGKPQDRFRT